MLKKSLALTLTSTALAVLAGCAVASYQAPSSGDTATVIVRHLTASGISHLYSYGNIRTCGELQSIVGGVQKFPEDYSFKVKVGAPVGLRYANSIGTRYCNVSVQFTPVIDGRYVLLLRSDTENCAMGVNAVVGGDLIPEPSRMSLVPSGGGVACTAVPPANQRNAEISEPGEGGGLVPRGVRLDDLKGLM